MRVKPSNHPDDRLINHYLPMNATSPSDDGDSKEQMNSLLNAASSLSGEGSDAKGSSTSQSPMKGSGALSDSDDVKPSSVDDTEEDVPMTFPQRLMEILSDEACFDIITWLPHGKGFVIYKKKTFASEVLPKYFKQSKFTSFTRKLNRWGFTRVTRGPETGAYYHKYFQRGDLRLCMQMSCQSAKPQAVIHPNAFAPSPMGMPKSMFPNTGNTDIAQQNQNLIRHQLQQLQMQQLQLQQLQLQQQHQLQAAELFRQAMANNNNNTNGSNMPSNELNSDHNNNLFMQTMQRTKESGSGFAGSQPIALIPALQASALSQQQQQQGDGSSLPNDGNSQENQLRGNGSGRAWAA